MAYIIHKNTFSAPCGTFYVRTEIWKENFEKNPIQLPNGVLPICKLPFPNGSYRNGVCRGLWANFDKKRRKSYSNMLIYAEPRFEHLTLSMATQTTSHKMDSKQENADFLYWIPILNSLEGDEISDFYYCLVRPENWKDWKKKYFGPGLLCF